MIRFVNRDHNLICKAGEHGITKIEKTLKKWQKFQKQIKQGPRKFSLTDFLIQTKS